MKQIPARGGERRGHFVKLHYTAFAGEEKDLIFPGKIF